MNREKGLAKKKLPEKQFIWIIVPLIIVCLLVVGLGGLKKLQLLVAPNQSSYPIAADEDVILSRSKPEAEIPIYLDKLSAAVCIPAGAHFHCFIPGDAELWFILADKKYQVIPIGKEEIEFADPTAPSCAFRILDKSSANEKPKEKQVAKISIKV